MGGADGDMPSTARLLNMKPGFENETRRGQPPQQTIYPEYFHSSPTKTPLDTDLNLFLRRRMSTLIGKQDRANHRFIDAIMDDDAKIENKAQMKLKMHAIVNRKCQNLLTSVFATEKMKFQKLLMIKLESARDALAVDETFERYESLKNEGMDQSGEKKANDFLKGILKIDYLANHISNLIMYSTTPLDDIIRYR